MFTFRFLLIFFISFLLLSPFIRHLKIYFEKPIIIIAQDNSESVIIAGKSGNIKESVAELFKSLKDEYAIKAFLFGERLREGQETSFNDQETNFDPLYDQIKSKYSNENIGALVIISDGIYNRGNNPAYWAKDLSFPVYTVTLGDTSKKKDVILKNVYSNEITFLGNYFPVELQIDAFGFEKEICNIKVFQNGKEIKSQQVNIVKKDFSTLIQFELLAEQKGLQTYLVKIDSKPGEYSLKNNTREFAIDVLEDKKKVLILSGYDLFRITLLRLV